MEISSAKSKRKLVVETRNVHSSNANIPGDLLVKHLHGTLSDLPNEVVFTTQQYGNQLVSVDSDYKILTSELLRHPFIFLGSTLNENELWKHIQMRRMKGRKYGTKELRPWSFLVTPALDPAREKTLSDFNITLIKMTAEKFTKEFLEKNTSETLSGLALLKRKSEENLETNESIPTVSELIIEETESSKIDKRYLLGATPKWTDITSGNAIVRDHENSWYQTINTDLSEEKGKKPLYIFIGTAGDGKTTFAMKMAARLSAEGKVVGWIDSDNSFSPYKIDYFVDNTVGIECLFIDTPEIYGNAIHSMIHDLIKNSSLKFVALIIRSSNVDNVLDGLNLSNIQLKELNTYKLTDNEINSLLDKLEEKNLLGALKGKNRIDQCRTFKEVADRQLIVAMIEATSGKRFSEIISDEYLKLNQEKKEIYCLVAVATSINHYLLPDEILISHRDASNSTANTIDNFVKRGMFVKNQEGGLRVRHKLIGERIADKLANENNLINYYLNLARNSLKSLKTITYRYFVSHRSLKSLTALGLGSGCN